METMVASASQSEEDSTEPVEVNMSQLYLQAVGGEKKRRVYGLGSQASAFYPETFRSSSTTSRYDFTSDERFTQCVNEVVGQRVRVEVQELQLKMNEDVRLYKEQLEQQFQQKMEQFERMFNAQSQSNAQHPNPTNPASTPP